MVRDVLPSPAEGLETEAMIYAKLTYHRMVRPTRRDAFEVIDRDALWGAAMLGAAKALATWDPERGVRFATHAICRIRAAILEEMRQWDWLSRGQRARCRAEERATGHTPEWALYPLWSFDELRLYDTEAGSEELALADMLSDPAEDTEAAALSAVALAEWERLVARLPDRERHAMERYYLDGESQQNIAVELGCSEATVKWMLRRAERRLREWIGEEP